MKKEFTENGFFVGPNNDLLVSLVSNEPEGDDNHDYDFVIYDLPTPIKNTGLVGVEDNERFAFKFQMQHSQDRFAFAAYVDGVSVAQDIEVVRLSSVSKKESYYEHYNAILLGLTDRPKECIYLETFLKKSGESPRLIFKHNEEKGVNFNFISEPSAMHKIEIFFWFERGGLTRSAVAEGEATYKKYPTYSTLENPYYIGKVTFMHKNADELKHLGDRIVHNSYQTA